MPGIAGLISRQPPEVCRRLVQQMTASMQHEKFHVSGSFDVPELGVFAGWVALECSLAAYQPILSEDGSLALLLSGECLPDEQTHARLRARGHVVDRDNVTWLIHLYDEKGDDFFRELNGLFSGIVIDRRKQRALLFNDRYGVERVYYHQSRDGFFFASEAKALLRVLPELRALDENGLAQFLHYGCTLRWNTLFRDIKILPGASAWSFVGDRCEKRRYFTPERWESQAILEPAEYAHNLEATFRRVLPAYFEADTDIAVSLTAGLDSRMIMACRPATSQGLVAYTLADSDRDTLDVRLASQVAAMCRVPHHVLRIDPDFFSNFASLVDRTVDATDGCLGPCGVHEIFLHQRARQLAPVRLTGNYGSEILRGATTFKPLGLSESLLGRDLKQSLSDAAIALTTPRAVHPVSFAAFQEIPWHSHGVFRAAQSQVTVRTPYLDNDLVALAFQIPERLRTSSSPALRVIRHNHGGLSRIPTDGGLVAASRFLSFANRFWYRASFKLDYWYTDGMPRGLSSLDTWLASLGLRPWSPGLHKFLHYGSWFRTKLAGYLRERLTDPTVARNPLWNRGFLHQLVNDHIAGRKNHVHEINTVLTLDGIDRLLLRQQLG